MSKSAQTATTSAKPLFPLGQTYATPGALEALSDAEQQAAEFLHRHQDGDWSEMSDGDGSVTTLLLPSEILARLAAMRLLKRCIIYNWSGIAPGHH
jgi:hypothetical protein